MSPGPDDFRALARSSPWRFRTLHFTHRELPDGQARIQAWLRRPGHLEVMDDAGERHMETGLPYTGGSLSLGWRVGPRWLPIPRWLAPAAAHPCWSR